MKSCFLITRTLIACVAILASRGALAASPVQVTVPSHTAMPPSMPSAQGQSTTLLPDGSWLQIGGKHKGLPGVSEDVWFVNARSGVATVANVRLKIPRAWHTATLLPDGRILVTGGVDGNGETLTSSEILDSTLASTELVSTGLLARAHHSATLLTDGRVLVAGGTGRDGEPLHTVELWDPRTAATTVLATELATLRLDHRADLLADGTVLLFEGTDGRGNRLSFGDVFDPVLERFSPVTTENSTVDMNVPFVEASQPVDGASGVPLDVVIAFRFSKLLQPESVNSSSITLEGPEGTVPIRVIPAEEGRLGFVTPLDPLTPNTQYTITLNGPKDNQSLALASQSISFTTTGSADGNQASSTNAPAIGAQIDSLPPLQAFPGITALAGQVRRVDGGPMVNVTLKVGSVSTRTDATGRFLLTGIPDGHSAMVIDGRSANLPGHTYGVFEAGVDILANRTNILTYTIWMTELDMAHAVHVRFPTTREIVITTPTLPGLEFHLPPHTVIKDIDGNIPSQISITPIPIDRPPFPLPMGVPVPIYFTIQPGGGYIQVLSKTGPRGATLIYPNSFHNPPGTRFDFYNYNPDHTGWYTYGHGTVSPNALSVVPDPGTVIYELTGAMVSVRSWFEHLADWLGFPHPKGGDPIDLGTGLFIYHQTDLYLPDVIPIDITRTYRQGDNASRDFGIGTTFLYDIAITGDLNNFSFVELVMPSGSRIRFDRISGNIWSNSTLQCISVPGPFFGAIFSNQQGWTITLRDGTIYRFLQPGLSGPSKIQDVALYAITDRNGNTLQVVRDANHYITQIVSPNGRWVAVTYDTQHRISKLQDSLGRIVQYSYDPTHGQLTQVIDANNGTWTYGYDPVATDQMTSITNPRKIVFLTNQYDSNGRVFKQFRADKTFYQFNYTVDSANNVTQTDETDPNGILRRVRFNPPPIYSNSGGSYQSGPPAASDTRAVGLPEQETFTYQLQPGTNLLLGISDTLGRLTRFGYDALGNMTSFTRLSGTSNAVTTSFTYDPRFNQVLTATDPLGHTTSFTYDNGGNIASATDPMGNTSTFSHNTGGLLVTATDPLGNSWNFGYNGGDLSSVTNPLGGTTSFVTDGGGRAVAITDPAGETTRYQYDPFGRVTQVTDPLGGVTSYQRDPDGNLSTVTDPKNTQNSTTYQYGDIDQLLSRTDPLGKAESYGYDKYGNLTCHTDRMGNITVIQYDGINRRRFTGFGAASCAATTFTSSITYKYDGGDRFTSVIDSLAGTITPVYDGLDRLFTETTPQGSVTFGYDNASRRTTFQVTGQPQIVYTYDNDDRLTKVTQGTAIVQFGYDTANRRTSVTLPNNVIENYTYDAKSHLTGITYKHGTAVLGNLSYLYDANGRRTQIGGSFARTNLPAALSAATYDVANRLTKWGTATVVFDANGRLSSDGANSYTFNNRNQLLSISGGTSATFAYDGYGRRISRSVGTTSTGLLYGGPNIVQELTAGAPSANISAGGLDEIFTRTDTATVGILRDALGGTLALTNSSGAIQTSYTYDPFGTSTATGTADSNPIQYAGRENDGTGLYFYRTRYYKPLFQRFISEDPFGFDGGINLFAYAGNSPTNYIDPLGLDPKAPSLKLEDGPVRDPSPNPGPAALDPPLPLPPPCHPQGGPPNPLLNNASFFLPGVGFGLTLNSPTNTLSLTYNFNITTSIGGALGHTKSEPSGGWGEWAPGVGFRSAPIGGWGASLEPLEHNWAVGPTTATFGQWEPVEPDGEIGKPFTIPFKFWPDCL